METAAELALQEEPQAQPHAGAVSPPKPPGGKALMRMVAAMERRGLHQLADARVAAVVHAEAKQAFEKARAFYSPAPQHLEDPNALPTEMRARALPDDVGSGLGAEITARLYMDAAEKSGIP
ncbi:MAG TPA: hypothetical protein VGC80_10810, partial [Acetobacteraceae bacterium]